VGIEASQTSLNATKIARQLTAQSNRLKALIVTDGAESFDVAERAADTSSEVRHVVAAVVVIGRHKACEAFTRESVADVVVLVEAVVATLIGEAAVAEPTRVGRVAVTHFKTANAQRVLEVLIIG